MILNFKSIKQNQFRENFLRTEFKKKLELTKTGTETKVFISLKALFGLFGLFNKLSWGFNKRKKKSFAVTSQNGYWA